MTWLMAVADKQADDKALQIYKILHVCDLHASNERILIFYLIMYFLLPEH